MFFGLKINEQFLKWQLAFEEQQANICPINGHIMQTLLFFLKFCSVLMQLFYSQCSVED